MKRISVSLVVSLSVLVFLGCGGSGGGSDTPSAASITSIEVSSQNNTLPVGTSTRITTIAILDDGTTQDVSSDASCISPDINTVFEDANINCEFEAKNIGRTSIAISYAGYSQRLDLEVIDATLVSLSLEVESSELGKGEELQVNAVGIFTDSSSMNLNHEVVWSSSDAAIASINDAGFLTSYTEGSVVIESSIDNIIAQVDINVGEAVLKGINISPTAAQVLRLTSVQFTAEGVYSDGSISDLSQMVTWTTTDATRVSIDSSGLAIGLLEGNGSISAENGLVSQSAIVDVIEESLTSIVITAADEVETERVISLMATGYYDNNTNKDVSNLVTWTSSDLNVATVSGNQLTGKNLGTLMVTASLSGQSEQVAVSVVKEKWWNYLSVRAGSASTVTINGYVQAGSWKYFQLVNTSNLDSLKITRIYGEDNAGTRYLDQVLSTDLAKGEGVSYKITLASNQYKPNMCYLIQDTSDGREEAVCLNW